jgi:hypothetical protein
VSTKDGNLIYNAVESGVRSFADDGDLWRFWMDGMVRKRKRNTEREREIARAHVVLGAPVECACDCAQVSSVSYSSVGRPRIVRVWTQSSLALRALHRLWPGGMIVLCLLSCFSHLVLIHIVAAVGLLSIARCEEVERL